MTIKKLPRMKDFKEKFREKTIGELNLMLQSKDDLSFTAKIDLLDVVRERDADNELVSELEKEIELEKTKIGSLSYLKNLGFTIIENGDELQVRRDSKASYTDVIGLFIGTILMLFLIPFSMNIINIFSGDMDVDFIAIISSTLFFVLFIIGFLVFSRNLSRILEFKGFRIVSNGSIDLKISKYGNTYSVPKNDLLIETGRRAKLSFMSNGSELVLIDFESNKVFNQTLLSLYEKL